MLNRVALPFFQSFRGASSFGSISRREISFKFSKIESACKLSQPVEGVFLPKDQEIFALGGTSACKFDVASSKWSNVVKVKDMHANKKQPVLAANGNVYLWGQTGLHQTSIALYQISTTDLSLTKIAPGFPYSRKTTVAVGNSIYVFGTSLVEDDDLEGNTIVSIFNTVEGVWENDEKERGKERPIFGEGSVAFPVNDETIVLLIPSEDGLLTDVWEYDIPHKFFRRRESSYEGEFVQIHTDSTYTKIGDYIFIFGGHIVQHSNEARILDLKTTTWLDTQQVIKGPRPSPQSGAFGVPISNNEFILYGGTGAFKDTHEVWRVQLEP